MTDRILVRNWSPAQAVIVTLNLQRLLSAQAPSLQATSTHKTRTRRARDLGQQDCKSLAESLLLLFHSSSAPRRRTFPIITRFMSNMFSRLRQRIQRAVSHENIHTGVPHAAMPAPPPLFAAPAPHPATLQDELPVVETTSPRKLRRTVAIHDLKAPVMNERRKQGTPSRSPQTPQHSKPISRKENNSSREEDELLYGKLTSDGSQVHLTCSEVLDISKNFSSSPFSEESPFNRVIGAQHSQDHRVASDATVIIHRVDTAGLNESNSNEDEEMLEGEEVIEQPDLPKGSRKRSRTMSEEDSDTDIVEPSRPRKQARTSPGSTMSARSPSPSPSPPQRSSPHRMRIARVRTQSAPLFGHKRRESIENDPSHPQGHKTARRVWSAEDVLRALHTGRANTEPGDTTPPPSPIISPATLLDSLHTLPSPRAPVTKLNRRPLSNVTDEFVPDFLRSSTPSIHEAEEPITPGCTFRCLIDTPTEIRNDLDLEGFGLDGATDSRIVAVEKDGQSTMITSQQSKTLENAEDNTEPKQPIISHVLRGLDNDAKFLQDALRQVKSLKEKVARHNRKTRSAKQWLDNHSVSFVTFCHNEAC